jgi:hypothetical protein
MRQTILFLVLGAIVNVAVAWAIAIADPDLQETMDGRSPTKLNQQGWVLESWFAERMDGFGKTVFGSTWLRKTINRPHAEGPLRPDDVLPDWLGLSTPPDGFTKGTSDWERLVAILDGWPLRSMMHVGYVDFKKEELISTDAIDLGVNAKGDNMFLPLRPLFPGFLVNTFFYAGVLAALFFAPGRIRRTLRHRRGRCVKCNYDRRGNPDAPCPECGTL